MNESVRTAMPDERFPAMTGTAIPAPVSSPDRLSTVTPDRHSVLIVVDVQNAFVEGGSLAVGDGGAVVPVINAISEAFDHIVITQDWHPRDHASFASRHPGRLPLESVEVAYGRQVLWPDHCVQGTPGAALVDGLDLPRAQLILRKGFHPGIDSYSAFMEADGTTSTGLAAYLQARGIDTVFVAGLATDFCVAWTALDARKAGFRTMVVEDATRAIDLDGSLDAAWRDMTAAGVGRIASGCIVGWARPG